MFIALLTTLALAAEPTTLEPPARETAGARVYGTARATVAVPVNYTGIAQSYSVEAGAMFRDGNQFGIRLAYVPYPPDVYGKDTPDHSGGPVLAWAYHVRVAPRVDLTPTVAAGAVFGPSPATGVNKVLPYLQAGVGMRAKVPTPGGGAIAFGPEIGIVPTLLAPYIAGNLTLIGRAPNPDATAIP